jgi:geranylgeranylglycerol-phosphate geranylgeranyltransferase
MEKSKFIRAYIKSMRPYLFFATGIAGWLGIVFSGTEVNILRKFLVLVLLFLSWGVNQIVNDYLGIKEDRINAPNRPMVSGELNIKYALITTFILFVIGAVISYILNPYALIVYFIGYIFNILYEYFKAVPFLGNIWFGILLSVCPFYGALAVGKKTLLMVLNNKDLIFVSLFVALMFSTMTFFTYYKDYKGDKKTGKKTLVVLLSPERARYLNFPMAFIPYMALFIILSSKLWLPDINIHFFILNSISFLLIFYTAFLLFRHPEGEKSASGLKWNFSGTVLFETSFIALVNPFLSIVLFVVSFLFVYYLFIFFQIE